MAALKAHLEAVPDRGDVRAALRHKLSLEVRGTTFSGDAANVLIHNISLTGLLIETSVDLQIGEAFEVEVPHVGVRSAVIIWSSGRLFGCEFEAAVPNAAISAALLQTPAEGSSRSASADAYPTNVQEDYVNDDVSRQPVKLPIRTRALIIFSFSLLAWAVIVSAIGLIMG